MKKNKRIAVWGVFYEDGTLYAIGKTKVRAEKLLNELGQGWRGAYKKQFHVYS